MQAIVDINRSRSAALARHVASFSALLFLVSALGHRYGLLGTPGFEAVLATVGALALISLLLAAAGLRSVWRDGDTGARDIAFAVIVASVVLTPFGLAVWKGMTLPPLHDISTDTVRPPVLPPPVPPLPGANAPAVFDAAMAERQRDGYPEIVGRRYPATVERVQAAVDAVLAAGHWKRLPAGEPADGAVTIAAEGETLVLGFPFVIAVRIGEEGDTTVVDMRSASRYGRYDFGDNARRITTFLNDLDLEIGRQAGT